jgi:hypothetical protein
VTAALLLPAGLAVLAAVAIPLLVHLARRTQAVPTDFAALRWLRQRPRPRQRPRFDEWPLLVARLLLVALLALFFARPVLIGEAQPRAIVAAVPGADTRGLGERAVWLAPGFPPVTDPAPAGYVPVASLLRELDATLPPGARLTVRVPATIEGADAERPVLSRAVDWQVVTGRMAPPRATTPVAVRLAVRDGGVAGAAYLRAAAVALGHRDAGSAAAPLPHAGALAWFVPGAVPDKVRDFAARGNVVLLPVTASLPGAETVWRDRLGASVAEGTAVGRGRMLRFVRPLVPAALPALVEPDFPDRLAEAIAPPRARPSRATARDLAPVIGDRAAGEGLATTDLRPWLALAVALLFLAERWLATRRRRAVTP